MRKGIYNRKFPMPTDGELGTLHIVSPNPPSHDQTLNAVIDSATLSIRGFVSKANLDSILKKHAFKTIREIFAKGLGTIPTKASKVAHRKRVLELSIKLLNLIDLKEPDVVVLGTVVLLPLFSLPLMPILQKQAF